MNLSRLFPLAVLASCTATKSPAPAEPIDESAQAPVYDAAVVRTGALPDARLLSPIPDRSKQLIVSLSEGWTGTDALLYRFERETDGLWHSVGGPTPSTIGHAGLGWGKGLHPEASDEGPRKREGDGRSPAGVFHIGNAYGYAKAPASTQLPFQKVTRSWRCVNDAGSKHYNRVLNTKDLEVDWSEAEHMRRWDDLYELVIEVDHNRILPSSGTPEDGDGSCIFLHVWRAPGKPTIGCTAMELESMKGLLSWLSPEASPVIVALPTARYESPRAAWQLPTIP